MKTRLPRRSTSDIRLNFIISLRRLRLRRTRAATSSMRLEKPHSLSYQEVTLTSVPSETRVRPASKIELAGLWLKSDDTSGSVLYSRMPLRSPSARLLHRVVHFLHRGRLLRHEGEVDDRHVDGRHADREAVELAVQVRQHQADRGGGAGLGRDHVVAGGARPAQVLVEHVGQHLVVGERVDGVHQARDHADAVVDRLDQRREAVGGARGVGDHRVARPSATCGSRRRPRCGRRPSRRARR